jgi:hypothetical protein
MTDTTMFDTHAFVKKLIAADMPESQAEVLADQQRDLIESRLVTKRDLDEAMTSMKRDLADAVMNLKIWFGSMLIFCVGALATLVKRL